MMRDNETRSMWLSNDTEVEIGYEYLDPERTVVLTQYDMDHHITGQIHFGVEDFSEVEELLNAVRPNGGVVTASQIKRGAITAEKPKATHTCGYGEEYGGRYW